MIRFTSKRVTVEDKSKEIPEIYAEDVEVSLKVFGVTVYRSKLTYQCEEKQHSDKKKIGFK